MLALAALLFAPAHAEDLRVEVPADIHAMALVCGSERIDRQHADGTPTPSGKLAFTFPINPGRSCDVVLIQTVGSVEQLGTWNCTTTGCTRTDAGSAPVSVGPGEIKLLMAADLTQTEVELSCDSGYRSRIPVVEHEAAFSGVPDGDECTLNLKGGAPLKFRPISPGAWQCHLVTGTLVCKPR